MNLKSKLPKRLQKYASFGVIPKLILLPFAVAVLLGMRLLRPLMLIHIHKVHDWRIGHFVTNTELTRIGEIFHNEKSRHKKVTIYYFGSANSSNQFLTKFWKRSLHSVSGHWGFLIDNLSSRIHLNSTSQSTAIDRSGLLIRYSAPNFFLENEHKLGREFVKAFCPNEKYVCLNVRDSAYLTQRRGLTYDNHNHRDSDIKTFVAAAETLAEMGYTVFRMGALVNEPLVSRHPRVIDYATNGMRTEFLDIYLGAKCKFCISTGSGWDSIPQIFRRPSMYVNLLPHFSIDCLVRDLVIYPKKVCKIESQNALTVEGLFESNAANSLSFYGFKAAGLEIRDLSSVELVEAVTEMAQRVEGTFVETPEQKEMQAKLKHILSTHPKLQPSPNYYPIRAQFASCFLSRYPNFLDGLD